MTDNRLVLTTAGSRDEARRIAEALVDRKLAACVNILPGVISVFRWKEKRQEEEECLLLIKTKAAASERVRDAIKEMHSYELPEFLCLAVEDGSAEYMQWLQRSVE